MPETVQMGAILNGLLILAIQVFSSSSEKRGNSFKLENLTPFSINILMTFFNRGRVWDS